jgi:beta-lactam-binding protein with PASTA domain
MKLRLRAINRFFNIVLGALAMFAVALTSAFISMRLAIHGREVKVPSLIGLPLADAGSEVRQLGLRLTLEDRFYSNNTAPGHILGQSPAPGTTVRRQWAVRVTESLGPQQVAVPDLTGESERTASINLRRLSLAVGTLAYTQAPGEPGLVLAQTPGPNASGIDRPRVSLLLSQPDDAESAPAIVMPSLVGLPLMSAAARASAAGLRIVSAEEVKQAAPNASASTNPASPSTQASATPVPATLATPTAGASVATVVAQTPLAGYRVTKGDPVRLSISY